MTTSTSTSTSTTIVSVEQTALQDWLSGEERSATDVLDSFDALCSIVADCRDADVFDYADGYDSDWGPRVYPVSDDSYAAYLVGVGNQITPAKRAAEFQRCSTFLIDDWNYPTIADAIEQVLLEANTLWNAPINPHPAASYVVCVRDPDASNDLHVFPTTASTRAIDIDLGNRFDGEPASASEAVEWINDTWDPTVTDPDASALILDVLRTVVHRYPGAIARLNDLAHNTTSHTDNLILDETTTAMIPDLASNVGPIDAATTPDIDQVVLDARQEALDRFGLNDTNADGDIDTVFIADAIARFNDTHTTPAEKFTGDAWRNDLEVGDEVRLDADGIRAATINNITTAADGSRRFGVSENGINLDVSDDDVW